jgi:ubiquinone/menaquinone biosynthesis C-methylase UbiE
MHDPEVVFNVLKLKEGDCFLDMGCGPGEYAIRASKIVGLSGVIYALDRSEMLIADLKRRVSEKGITNIIAMVADITGPLPVKEGCVDVCLVATVFHIPDITQSANVLGDGIRRVLKPDGRLAIIECHKENLSFGPPQHMRLSPEEVEALLSPCNFRKERVIDLGYNYMIQFSVE